MAEEIGFENGRNSNFEGLVTLTLTLDPAIRHTVVHHSSTSTYIPNFIEIEETFCGRTDGHFPPSNIIRSTFGSRPKNFKNTVHQSTLQKKTVEHRFSTVELGKGDRKRCVFSQRLKVPSVCDDGWQAVPDARSSDEEGPVTNRRTTR